MAKLICDTNVFYDLGESRIKREQFASEGDELWYSPLSTLEIAGKLDESNYARRKASAKAILELGAQELPDPEALLVKAFGYTLEREPLALHDIVRALAQSDSFEEVAQGVPDPDGGVTLSVDLQPIAKWRQETEQKWVEDVTKVVCDFNPKFKTWWDPDPKKRTHRTVPKLRKSEKEKLEKVTKSIACDAGILEACRKRAALSATRESVVDVAQRLGQAINSGAPGEGPTPFLEALYSFECYTKMYTRYVVRALTTGELPKPNDSGDLELFLHAVDDDHVIVTSDRKWVEICREAGFAQRVRKPREEP